MKLEIKNLFKEYEKIFGKDEKSHILSNSGYLNKYEELDYGFFPLGTGIFNLNIENKSKPIKISKNSIMILGNDFGWLGYLNPLLKDKKENKNAATIRNLRNLLFESKIEIEDCFCTNFYMGIRENGTNTERVITPKREYKDLCYKFFLKQLELLQPKLIICLGNDVRFAMLENSIRVDNWDPPGDGIIKICSDKEKYRLLHKKVDVEKIGQFDFMLIPHPSHGPNLTPTIKENVTAILKADV